MQTEMIKQTGKCWSKGDLSPAQCWRHNRLSRRHPIKVLKVTIQFTCNGDEVGSQIFV